VSAPSPIVRRELPDPREGRNPLPTLFLLYLGALTAFGFAYFSDNAGADLAFGGDQRSVRDPAPVVRTGESIFKTNCASCHQATGLGVVGAFPPLAGSPWVLADAETPARIVLRGLQGTIEVKGATYNGVMPSFGSTLSDDDIAKVVTYVRASFGNEAPPLTAETVKLVRATDGRGDAWKGGAALEAARGR
jgi:mono/diheme cytochrome c family protein